MNRTSKPTCVIADDHEIVLDGLATTLSPLLDVIARVPDGNAALAAALQHVPDLLFLDLRMPGPGVAAIASRLRSDGVATRIIVFSSVTAVERVREAFDGGASGYLSKDAPTGMLEDAVQSVLAGRRFLDPVLAPEVVSSATPELTPREFETLQLMAGGAQNAAIAFELGISAETVKSHVASILRKLESVSRTGAVAHAIRSGVVD